MEVPNEAAMATTTIDDIHCAVMPTFPWNNTWCNHSSFGEGIGAFIISGDIIQLKPHQRWASSPSLQSSWWCHGSTPSIHKIILSRGLLFQGQIIPFTSKIYLRQSQPPCCVSRYSLSSSWWINSDRLIHLDFFIPNQGYRVHPSREWLPQTKIWSSERGEEHIFHSSSSHT